MVTILRQHFSYITQSASSGNYTQVLVWVHNLMGFYSFWRLGRRMKSTVAGIDILERRPRISKRFILSHHLDALPQNSFGKLYINFMLENGFDREIKKPPRSPFESELTGYAKTRWIETHDFRHVLTGFTASLADEAMIAGFQFGNLPNGWSFMVMIIGPILSWRQLNPIKQWWRMVEAFKAGRDAVCLGSVSYENEFATPIDDLRKKWSIKDLTHLSSRFS